MSADPTYYAPPEQWCAPALIASYMRLASSYHIAQPRKFRINTSHTLLEAQAALRELSLGIKSNDQACIWLAAEFVISPALFSGSGRIKATMARRLRSAHLDEQTKTLLRRGIFALWSSGQYRQEWRVYAQLLRSISLGAEAKSFASIEAKAHLEVRALVKELGAIQNAA